MLISTECEQLVSLMPLDSSSSEHITSKNNSIALSMAISSLSASGLHDCAALFNWPKVNYELRFNNYILVAGIVLGLQPEILCSVGRDPLVHLGPVGVDNPGSTLSDDLDELMDSGKAFDQCTLSSGLILNATKLSERRFVLSDPNMWRGGGYCMSYEYRNGFGVLLILRNATSNIKTDVLSRLRLQKEYVNVAMNYLGLIQPHIFSWYDDLMLSSV